MSGDATEDIGAYAHAWKYFELHAHQRMSTFNFFLVLAGLIAAGVGSSFSTMPAVSAVLGVMLTVVSVVFWRLDQRVAFFVKHAERSLVACETCFPEHARLFTTEPDATAKARQRAVMWTYGRCFRLVFLLMGIAGLATAIVALGNLSGMPAGTVAG